MAYELDLIRQLHPFFWKNNVYFMVYMGCLLCLFLFRKKEQWKSGYRGIFWYSVVVLIVICYNPLFARLTYYRLWYDMSTYVRVFLILPVILTVAYVFSGLIGMMPRIAGDVVLAGLVVLMIVYGETPGDHEMYMAAENPYKINTEAVQISDMIGRELPERERCMVYIPAQLDEVHGTDLVSMGMRQYDATFIITDTFPMAVSKEELENGDFEQYLEEIEENADLPVYVLCLTEENMIKEMEKCGYRSLGRTEHFSVMRREN